MGPSPDMRGRVCLITGANSGIGKAIAIGLAQLGADVVLLGRDTQRVAQARDEVQHEARGGTVSSVLADLASLDSIRAAVTQIEGQFPAIHVLVNNAGVNVIRRKETVDGLEMSLAVNHLGPFLLTNLLLPLLRAGAPSRIVNIASNFERMGKIDFNDLQLTKGYSATRAYNQSKLANVMFTYALARRLEGTGITANCVHPGLVDTRLMREWPRWMTALWGRFLLTPQKGARGAVWLASSPEAEGITGRYFEGVGRAKRSSRRSYDQEGQERLWRMSAELTELVPSRRS